MTNDNSNESENKKSPHLSERSSDKIQNGGNKTADGKQNGVEISGKENQAVDDVSLGM